jgi:hypothetical protein
MAPDPAACSSDHASFSCVHPSSSLSQARFSPSTSASRVDWLATQARVRPDRRDAIAVAAALASPQMPTVIGFTSPSIRGSASTWMILAFFGQ